MSAQFVSMNGLLTQSELAFYWENGYLVKHELFSSDEVRQLSEAAEKSVSIAKEFVATKSLENKEYSIDGNRFVDIQFHGSTTVQYEHDLAKRDIVRVLEPVHHFDNIFEKLVDSQRLVGPMEQILGKAEGVSLWTSKLNLKRPQGSPFMFHQDSPYWEYDCKHNVDHLPNVIVYIDDATVENGALRIVKGSHKRGILPGRADEGFEFPGFFTDTSVFSDKNAVSILANAGSACFFDPHTVHGSMGNATNKSRRAIILTYQPRNFPLLKNGRIRNCVRHSPKMYHEACGLPKNCVNSTQNCDSINSICRCDVNNSATNRNSNVSKL